MPYKWPKFALVAIGSLGLMVGCHHRKPTPYIDPSREMLPQVRNVPSPKPAPPPAKPEKRIIHDAKIPMSCVSDLDQDASSCRMTANPSVANCDHVLIRFNCLSYRNQKGTQP